MSALLYIYSTMHSYAFGEDIMLQYDMSFLFWLRKYLPFFKKRKTRDDALEIQQLQQLSTAPHSSVKGKTLFLS